MQKIGGLYDHKSTVELPLGVRLHKRLLKALLDIFDPYEYVNFWAMFPCQYTKACRSYVT